jgi:hypothetical protein
MSGTEFGGRPPFPGTYYNNVLDSLGCIRRHGKDYDQYSTLTPNILNPGDKLEDLVNLFHQNFASLNRSLKESKGITDSLKLDFLRWRNNLQYQGKGGFVLDLELTERGQP